MKATQLRSDKSKSTQIVEAREELDVACDRENVRLIF